MSHSILKNLDFVGILPAPEEPTIAHFLASIPSDSENHYMIVDPFGDIMLVTKGNQVTSVEDQAWFDTKVAPLVAKYKNEGNLERIALIRSQTHEEREYSVGAFMNWLSAR